jgi:hypothetical protein
MSAVRMNAIVAATAIAGGFLGSTLHQWLRTGSNVIRAQRFEIVGSSGKILSYWGPDSDPQIPAATPKGTLLVFIDPDGVRRFQLGSRAGDYGPELQLYGKDGPRAERLQYVPEPRLAIGLGYNDDPFLGMRDRRSWRIFLGGQHGDAPSLEDDDWGITFRSWTNAESYMGTHNVKSGKSQAFVSVRDGQGKTWTVPPDFHYQIDRVPIVPRAIPGPGVN